MSAGARLWLRFGAFAALAGVSVVALSPPRPEHVPLASAELPAILTGAVLFVLLHGPGTRLSRPRIPPSIAGARVAVLLALALQEEVLWRRAMLGEALAVSTAFALATSTAGFAWVHPGDRARQLVTGAVFGGVYLRSGSLVAAASTHLVYNLLVAAATDARRARASPGVA